MEESDGDSDSLGERIVALERRWWQLRIHGGSETCGEGDGESESQPTSLYIVKAIN